LGPQALARFAYALTRHLRSSPEEVGRRQAAALEAAAAQREDAAQRAILETLRLVARASADAAVDERRARELRQEGPLRQRVLTVLQGSADGLRPAEIGARLNVHANSLSRLLNQMARAGLLEKYVPHNSLDGRAVHYRISAAGEADAADARRLEVVPVDLSEAGLARSRHEAARNILEGVVERRRKGVVGKEDDLERVRRVAAVAAETGDNVLLADAIGEQVTQLRHSVPAAGASSVGARVRRALEHLPAFDDYAQARRFYEEGRLQLAKLTVDPSEPAALFTRTLDHLHSHPDSGLNVWARLALAETCRRDGALEAAIRHAGRAYDFAVEQGRTYPELRAGLELGMAYRIAGQVRQGSQLLRRVVANADGSGYDDLQAEAQFQLGELRRYQGELSEASDLFDRASEGLEGTDRLRRRRAYFLSARGALLFDMTDQSDQQRTRRLAAAHELLAEAVRIAHEAKVPAAEALSLRRLGIVLAQEGRDDEAIEKFEDALAIYSSRRTQSLVGQLECRASLAMVNPAGQTIDEATEVFDQVVQRLASKSSDTEGPTLGVVIDPWLHKSLLANARRVHATAAIERVDAGWSELHSRRLAAGQSSSNGLSVMGKEPLLIA
jgi:tetratricopeptide (TPR) repeat protein